MTPDVLATLGVGVALLAVLVPLVLTLHNRTTADIAQLRGELAELRQTLADVDRRLARLEGAVIGPRDPAEPPS